MAEKHMTTNLSDRVRWLLAEKNLSQAELAKKAGVKQPSVFAWVKGNTKKIGLEPAMRISRTFGVPLRWIKDGVGEPTDAEDSPGGIVQAYIPGEETPPAGCVAVPEYRLTLAANTAPGDEPTWEEVNDAVPHWMPESFFLKKGVRPERCRFGRVDGDSMEPTLCDGDKVLWAEESDPRAGCVRIRDGAIYAVGIEGDLKVKRLRRIQDGIEVVSDNPAYKVMTYTGEAADRLRVFGRVLHVSREL